MGRFRKNKSRTKELLEKFALEANPEDEGQGGEVWPHFHISLPLARRDGTLATEQATAEPCASCCLLASQQDIFQPSTRLQDASRPQPLACMVFICCNGPPLRFKPPYTGKPPVKAVGDS